MPHHWSDMNVRLPFSWFDIKDSLWYRPAIMTALAIALSFVTIGLDHVLFQEQRVHAWWLFEGGAEGARGVLSAIAGTMMTVATTAFSFTLVALQLSSSQYSPRIVRNFTGDRVNQLVIGAFVGTFVYTLLVLRVVRSESADFETFVPAISVSVALVLALVCIASLIYFFHHATRTIQSSVVIARATESSLDLIGHIHSRFDAYDWRPSSETLDRPERVSVVGTMRGTKSGYVQDIDHGRLLDLATRHNLLVAVNARPGDFLFPGDPQLTLWAYLQDAPQMDSNADAPWDNGDILDQFRGLVTLGLERTLERDVRYGFQQVTDIAVRALSPGINDPNTAIACIDRIGELLIAAERISYLHASLLDEKAVVRVMQPEVSWHEFVENALLQLRHFASSDPGVAIYLIRTLGRVMEQVSPASAGVLGNVARDVAEGTLLHAEIESDRQRIRDALKSVTDQP
jgi:uncharacterized membrane protein